MPPRPVPALDPPSSTPSPPDGEAGELPSVRVRKARLADVPELLRISHAIYGDRGSWKAEELRLHQQIFPDGQFVAEDPGTGRVLGMAVSLVVSPDQWPLEVPWRVITDHGRLTTHTGSGDTLYAAGVAVDPAARGLGVGSELYRGREALVVELGLSRIRAGARIPGYGAVADRMSPEAYVEEVVRGLRKDPTLSFQLAMGFQVLGVAPGYLRTDRASRGYAAVVEWRAPK